MALGIFVAGRYLCSYDPPGAPLAADFGLTRRGYRLSVTHGKQVINESDGYGLMTIDAVYRGISNVFMNCRLMEWKNSVLAAVFPYGATVTAAGAGYLGPGVVGRLDSDIAGILTMTPVAGTPAAVLGTPLSVGALYSIIAEDFPVEFDLNSELRELDMRFRILPWDDAGVCKLLTFT